VKKENAKKKRKKRKGKKERKKYITAYYDKSIEQSNAENFLFIVGKS
jgi:ribonucleotide reductase beta subunit family protein with ferritin-like domain